MDPLAQLKDIHLPADIHHYPIAYGWWILLAIIIVFLIISITTVLKNKRKTRAQSTAIKHLSQTVEDNDDVITTLKWAAIQYFPREAIAQLHGKQLNDFLLTQLPEKHHAKFTQLAEQGFNNRYQINEKALDNDLLQAAMLWLKHALPAKNTQKTSGDPS